MWQMMKLTNSLKNTNYETETLPAPVSALTPHADRAERVSEAADGYVILPPSIPLSLSHTHIQDNGSKQPSLSLF